MLIPFQCPNCQARLNVPDAAAGKRIQCPKCQTAVAVPPGTPTKPSHPSHVVPPPSNRIPARDEPANTRNRPSTPSTSQPTHRPGPVPPPIPTPTGPDPEAGTELSPYSLDDATPTVEPQRSSAPEASSTGNQSLLLLVLGCATVLLLLGSVGIVGAAWYLVRLPDRDVVNDSENDRPTTTKTDSQTGKPRVGKAAIPTGWKKLEPPGAGWKIYLPGDTAGEPINPDPMLPRIYTAMNIEQKVLCAISVIDLKAVAAPQRELTIEKFVQTLSRGRFTEISRKDTTLAGLSAKELVFDTATQVPGGDKAGAVKPQSVVRMLITESALYYLIITNGEPGRPKPEFENGFFDNFELTK